jgi:uncharacterized repeat protein (TIGR03803 family)
LFQSSDGNFYGAATGGGTYGKGTIFKLTMPATLYCRYTANGVVLGWNNPAFALQSAPSISGTYTNIPGATSPYTNAVADPQQFFRLIQSQ